MATTEANYSFGLGIPRHNTHCVSPCWEVLGVRPDADFSLVRTAYLKLAQVRHPDHGGSSEAMQELNNAYEAAMKIRRPVS